MPNLSIKNVPEQVVEKLRARAHRNHRSLQGELMALICEAAEPSAKAGPASGRGLRTGTKTIEQIAAEHRDRWPKPFDQGPRSVDLIRADRDAR